MVVQSVNQYALGKYQDFVSALELVLYALNETDPLIKAMVETGPARADGWKVPAKKEVLGARAQVADQLDVVRAKAKEYEKQLIANGWRV